MDIQNEQKISEHFSKIITPLKRTAELIKKKLSEKNIELNYNDLICDFYYPEPYDEIPEFSFFNYESYNPSKHDLKYIKESLKIPEIYEYLFENKIKVKLYLEPFLKQGEPFHPLFLKCLYDEKLTKIEHSPNEITVIYFGDADNDFIYEFNQLVKSHNNSHKIKIRFLILISEYKIKEIIY